VLGSVERKIGVCFSERRFTLRFQLDSKWWGLTYSKNPRLFGLGNTHCIVDNIYFCMLGCEQYYSSINSELWAITPAIDSWDVNNGSRIFHTKQICPIPVCPMRRETCPARLGRGNMLWGFNRVRLGKVSNKCPFGISRKIIFFWTFIFGIHRKNYLSRLNLRSWLCTFF